MRYLLHTLILLSIAIYTVYGIIMTIYGCNQPSCGIGGIPASNWLYIVGIQYIVIGLCYVISYIFVIKFDFQWPLFLTCLIGTALTLAWCGYGIEAFFINGYTCFNTPVWGLGVSNIISMISYSIILLLLILPKLDNI